MAIARIEVLAGLTPAEKLDRVEAVHRAVVASLHVPEDDPLVLLTEVGRDAVALPSAASDGFTVVQITLFAGRSAATKRRLYQEVAVSLQRVGVSRTDVLVVLVESPLENWAVWGGIPATDVELGFDLEG